MAISICHNSHCVAVCTIFQEAGLYKTSLTSFVMWVPFISEQDRNANVFKATFSVRCMTFLNFS